MGDSVVLASYDPNWPNKFTEARTELLSKFSAELLAVEHIGSTAVPGILAKPIIDLLGGVSSVAATDELIPRLLRCGWDTSEEFNRTIGDRRFLLKWPDGVRTHHLHLVVFESPLWSAPIIFRDRLREDAALRGEYERLKLELAGRFCDDREGYTAGKENFVLRVVEEARAPHRKVEL